MRTLGKSGGVCRAGMVLAALALSTPVLAQPAAGETTVWDPFEDFNRAMYSFNEAFNSAAAAPLLEGYREYVPPAVRQSVDNFFSNLREPVTAVASTLQGDLTNAGLSLGRFAINSTAGIGGLFDVASELDWRSRPQDLGVTLCKYGVPSGPYVVLPFFGSSTLRETAGTFATYTLAYNVSHDLFPAYFVADSFAAKVQEPAPAVNAPAAIPAPADAGPVVQQSYEADRLAYIQFRDRFCANDVETEILAAGPLGKVKPLAK